MGQRLSTMQTIGVMMILAGATLASIHWNEISNQSFQLSAGVKEAIFGAFFFGAFWNISELISEEVGWLLTTLLVKFGIIVFLLLFALPAKQAIGLTNISTKTKIMILLMGMIEAGAVALVNYGLTIGDAILITPIASALSVVTIALAIIFLNDKVTKIQGVGILTTIAGIIVTAF
jgi:drug/metabolite transporter (DMT)-like permease